MPGLISGRKMVPVPPSPLPGKLYACIDGTGVPVTGKETAGRDGICAAARAYPLVGVKKDEPGTALGYFENNAPRMRYHRFRSRGPFAGSGVAESGCKAVIGQRLKLSGTRWTVAGAEAITTLRGRQASRPEDRIWHTAQPGVGRLTSPTR